MLKIPPHLLLSLLMKKRQDNRRPSVNCFERTFSDTILIFSSLCKIINISACPCTSVNNGLLTFLIGFLLGVSACRFMVLVCHQSRHILVRVCRSFPNCSDRKSIVQLERNLHNNSEDSSATNSMHFSPLQVSNATCWHSLFFWLIQMVCSK